MFCVPLSRWKESESVFCPTEKRERERERFFPLSLCIQSIVLLSFLSHNLSCSLFFFFSFLLLLLPPCGFVSEFLCSLRARTRLVSRYGAGRRGLCPAQALGDGAVETGNLDCRRSRCRLEEVFSFAILGQPGGLAGLCSVVDDVSGPRCSAVVLDEDRLRSAHTATAEVEQSSMAATKAPLRRRRQRRRRRRCRRKVARDQGRASWALRPAR